MILVRCWSNLYLKKVPGAWISLCSGVYSSFFSPDNHTAFLMLILILVFILSLLYFKLNWEILENSSAVVME